MQTGYTFVCDYWSLGVIMYEMLMGESCCGVELKGSETVVMKHCRSPCQSERFIFIFVHFEQPTFGKVHSVSVP